LQSISISGVECFNSDSTRLAFCMLSASEHFKKFSAELKLKSFRKSWNAVASFSEMRGCEEKFSLIKLTYASSSKRHENSQSFHGKLKIFVQFKVSTSTLSSHALLLWHSLTFPPLLIPTSTRPSQIAFKMHVASPPKPDATISYRQSISFMSNEVDLGAPTRSCCQQRARRHSGRNRLCG
jgi:hypothetical protein